MWREEVWGSNNCLEGLTRFQLNHRKTRYKSRISLSNVKNIHFQPRAEVNILDLRVLEENLFLLIVAVKFLKNFSKILYGFNLTAVERVEFLRDVPRGLEEAEMIMAGERFLITNLYIPFLIWELLNGSALLKTKRGGKWFFQSNFHIVGGNVGTLVRLIDNWLMELVAIIVSGILGRIQSKMGSQEVLLYTPATLVTDNGHFPRKQYSTGACQVNTWF